MPIPIIMGVGAGLTGVAAIGSGVHSNEKITDDDECDEDEIE